MICGAESLIKVCKEKIAPRPHMLSPDGKFSWEEVECLGACANAPMAQIGKDYYEDLTAENFGRLLDDLAAGKIPQPGPQNGRFACEPLGGPTTLKDMAGEDLNGSVALAMRIGDTVKRIDGTEVPLVAPWLSQVAPKATNTTPDVPVVPGAEEAPAAPGVKPALLTDAQGAADDLKKIKGVGPKLEALLNSMGVFHFWQVANWSPDEVAWVDENLEGFKGRVSRDDWVAQAKILADGGETEFSARQ